MSKPCCPECGGSGKRYITVDYRDHSQNDPCPTCQGKTPVKHCLCLSDTLISEYCRVHGQAADKTVTNPESQETKQVMNDEQLRGLRADFSRYVAEDLASESPAEAVTADGLTAILVELDHNIDYGDTEEAIQVAHAAIEAYYSAKFERALGADEPIGDPGQYVAGDPADERYDFRAEARTRWYSDR